MRAAPEVVVILAGPAQGLGASVEEVGSLEGIVARAPGEAETGGERLEIVTGPQPEAELRQTAFSACDFVRTGREA